MAQQRIHDFRGEATSALLNLRWYEAMGNFVLNGLAVVPGTTGMKVTVQAGSGLIAGLTFVESGNLPDVVTLSTGHTTYTRIDSVVAQYIRAESEPVPVVAFLVAQGTPSSNPQPPAVADNQLRLANITVPPGTTLVTSDMITNMPKLRDRLQALVPYGVLTARSQPLYVEGVIWKRPSDPLTDSTITVEVGDIWCDTGDSPPTYYLWDGSEWLDIQAWENIHNRPTSMPPDVHELDGDAHSGLLPLRRVSGHTAFGPPAHQEAFAASALRRP
ncbi:MAG: hypothetical protein PHZ19_11165 [Candidatus Thermoplasmatota archaeon]|nr:hypothetical protein [Candidatus Thermoplasmatota archaeon]